MAALVLARDPGLTRQEVADVLRRVRRASLAKLRAEVEPVEPAALGRFLRWHHANRRTLLQTEARFTTVVELDDGEQVRLSGFADRLELDEDGAAGAVCPWAASTAASPT